MKPGQSKAKDTAAARRQYLDAYAKQKAEFDGELLASAARIYDRLIKSPDAVARALIHTINHNELYGTLLIEARGNMSKTHDIVWIGIKTYLREIATELAEDKL